MIGWCGSAAGSASAVPHRGRRGARPARRGAESYWLDKGKRRRQRRGPVATSLQSQATGCDGATGECHRARQSEHLCATWLAWTVRAALVVLLLADATDGQQYSLSFSKSSSRMSWNHRLPSWSYSAPVRLSAPGDSTSMLRINTSASMRSTFDDRGDSRNWQDNASVSSSINYPILGPRASIRMGANMSVRSATLTKQKIRNQSYNFGFQYSPLQEGRFNSLRISVSPGLITASRANRANLDSTFEERGIQYNATIRVSPELELGGSKVSNSLSLSKMDNTLKSNRNRSESLSSSLGYTWPGDVRTNLSLRESRSQVGIPRRLVTEREMASEVVRDTTVVVETQKTRNSRISGNVSLKVAGYDVRSSGSYSENLRTNTASDDPRSTYYGKDRESKSWSVDMSLSGKLLEPLVGRSSFRIKGSDEGFLPVQMWAGDAYRDPSSDLERRDLFLNGSLDWQIARKHSLKLSTYLELTSEANPGNREQDRDVHTNSVSLSYDGTTAGGTNVTASLESKYLHRVSLDATRSADNSRNRDLSLNFNTRYQRLGISISHAFSISARRTIYDFDREINTSEQLRQSNIRRGWSMVHTARRSIIGNIQLNGRYSYSADDFGVLLVERGSQIVAEDNGDHRVSLGVAYSPLRSLSTSANYSYSLDRQWKYEYTNYLEDRYLYRRHERESLSVSANYNSASGTKLSVRGSRSRQFSGTYDSVSITYSRPL